MYTSIQRGAPVRLLVFRYSCSVGISYNKHADRQVRRTRGNAMQNERDQKRARIFKAIKSDRSPSHSQGSQPQQSHSGRQFTRC